MCSSLDKLQNNSEPFSVTLTASLASTPQLPNCITAIIWKVTLGCKIVLSPFDILNVCFHMIAVMQFGDWGVEASEAIRVTDNGSELFCDFPKELHIKS